MTIFDKKSIDHFKSNAHKQTPEWYISTYNTFTSIALSHDHTEIDTIHNLIHAHIDKKEFDAFMNPFNFKEARHKNIPGKYRNYDLIMKNLRKFIGEYITSFQEFHIVSKLPNEDNEILEAANELAYKLLSKRAMAQIQQVAGGATDPNANTNIAAEVDNFKSKWKDNRVINDYNMLEYIKAFSRDSYLYSQCYMHWITYGSYFIEHRIYRDDVEKNVWHPKDTYPVINDADFVEDYEAIYHKGSKSLTQILSQYGDILSERDKTYLKSIENNSSTSSTTGSSTKMIEGLYNGIKAMPNSLDDVADFTSNISSIECGTLYYKGFNEIQILKHVDVLGNELEVEVDIDYELNPTIGDISLTKDFIPLVFAQYRFGSKAHGVYTKPIELAVQRQMINNSGIVKLPVTGKIHIFPNFPNHSIPKILYPFQVTVNLLEMAKERAIITSQGKIAIIPKEMLGSNEVDQEEEMYNMLVLKKLFPVMENISNIGTVINSLRDIDLSDTAYVQMLSDLVIMTKEAANDAIDMNRQREGKTFSSDGKGSNEQAVEQASIGSAVINDTFDMSRCKDYEADIDFSKVAWINGKKAKFMTSDRQRAFFEVNPIAHAETEYGAFATTSFEYVKQKKAILDYAFALGQSGKADEDTMLDMITNNNISKLKEILQISKYLRQAREDAQFKQEQDTRKQESDNNVKIAEMASEDFKWKENQSNLTDLLVKQVDLDIKELDMLQSDKDNDVLKNLQERKQELQTQINIMRR